MAVAAGWAKDGLGRQNTDPSLGAATGARAGPPAQPRPPSARRSCGRGQMASANSRHSSLAIQLRILSTSGSHRGHLVRRLPGSRSHPCLLQAPVAADPVCEVVPYAPPDGTTDCAAGSAISRHSSLAIQLRRSTILGTPTVRLHHRAPKPTRTRAPRRQPPECAPTAQPAPSQRPASAQPAPSQRPLRAARAGRPAAAFVQRGEQTLLLASLSSTTRPCRNPPPLPKEGRLSVAPGRLALSSVSGAKASRHWSS
jgi:hypothetical protein